MSMQSTDRQPSGFEVWTRTRIYLFKNANISLKVKTGENIRVDTIENFQTAKPQIKPFKRNVNQCSLLLISVWYCSLYSRGVTSKANFEINLRENPTTQLTF
jgi:hypothetical protein